MDSDRTGAEGAFTLFLVCVEAVSSSGGVVVVVKSSISQTVNSKYYSSGFISFLFPLTSSVRHNTV